MTDGLPADLVAIGWEKDGACAVQQPEAIAAKLASTGADSASSFGLGAGALALALIGLGFMFAIRPRTRA
jgi:LPXTG-motif cell wall-anchored protein